jgi:uncharacterized protein with PIN domain
MANRQRDFLMAANHYRAGRITIDEFKQKVLAAIVVQGEVAVMYDPQASAVDLSSVKDAIGKIETAGASVLEVEVEGGDLPTAEHLQKRLKSAGAVLMIALIGAEAVNQVAQQTEAPLFVVPGSNDNAQELTSLTEALPASVAIVGKGQAASAARIAVSVARP